MAITEPNISDRYYYFNVSKNELFGFTENKEGTFPIFRNNWTKADKNILDLFQNALYDKMKNSKDLILLPKLNLVEKKEFLLQFAKCVTPIELSNSLIYESEEFSQKDEFGFRTDLQAINKKVFFDFEMVKLKFLNEKIRKYVNPIGVSENAKVIW